MSHFEQMPVDIYGFSTLRRQALTAIQTAANTHTQTDDATSALAQALTDAPGSAVLAVELTKIAARAHDQRQLQRFIQIARALTAEQPNLSRMLDAIGDGTHADVGSRMHEDTHSPSLGPKPAQRMPGMATLDAVCGWLVQAFAQGRAPVHDVSQQGTDSIECRLSPAYALSPEVLANFVVVAARGQQDRNFAWVAAKYKGAVWLSDNLAETLAPLFHPGGNGFTIELQKTAVYRGGEPELTAYITERRTVIDVALNEKTVFDQHRIVIMTFDRDPPEVSAPVVLHSRTERSVVDIHDDALPHGYRHSPNIGTVSEQTFRLQWGDNRAKLTPVGLPGAAPREQALFGP